MLDVTSSCSSLATRIASAAKSDAAISVAIEVDTATLGTAASGLVNAAEASGIEAVD
jgi:hypothetical protein